MFITRTYSYIDVSMASQSKLRAHAAALRVLRNERAHKHYERTLKKLGRARMILMPQIVVPRYTCDERLQRQNCLTSVRYGARVLLVAECRTLC